MTCTKSPGISSGGCWGHLVLPPHSSFPRGYHTSMGNLGYALHSMCRPKAESCPGSPCLALKVSHGWEISSLSSFSLHYFPISFASKV